MELLRWCGGAMRTFFPTGQTPLDGASDELVGGRKGPRRSPRLGRDP